MKRSVPIVSVAMVVFFGLVGAAWGQSYSVNVGGSGNIQYLTDSNGMTLYYFTKDVGGTSACYGGCEKLWPVFYSGNLSVPSSLNSADFGTITRTDGSMQTTYKGWPLYYFAADKSAGDMKGEDAHHIWYIMTVPFYNVMVGTSASLGNYLTDANGMTLYYFTKDATDKSACYGNCAKLWPVFYAPNVVATSNLKSSDFGSITRDDGTMQTTYKGYPLYYWVHDKNRGETTGQDVGKVWYVIDPEKFNPGM